MRLVNSHEIKLSVVNTKAHFTISFFLTKMMGLDQGLVDSRIIPSLACQQFVVQIRHGEQKECGEDVA